MSAIKVRISALFMFFYLIFVTSCDVAKMSSGPARSNNPSQPKTSNNEVEIYNPVTGKYEKVKNSTVDNSEPKDSDFPKNSEEKPAVKKQKNKKNIHQIAIFLPFFSDKTSNDSKELFDKSDWATNFYAGAKLALKKLENEGKKLKVSVFDTKASEAELQKLLLLPAARNSDIFIGPAAKNNVKIAADFAKNNNKIFISPYYPSDANAVVENPNFIQVNPSLKTHCEAIMKNIRAKYRSNQVVLICRNKANESGALTYFQEENKKLGGDKLKELVTDDESASLSSVDIAPYILKGQTTVFIVPSWSSEGFVAALLRKIENARKNNKVEVYGMPQWTTFTQIGYEIYENLNLHISSNIFIDNDNFAVKEFKKNYFSEYQTAPENAAFIGYDVTYYFGDLLDKYGIGFPQYLTSEKIEMLHTFFDFRADRSGRIGESSDIQKYENKSVQILEFKNMYFQKAQ